MNFQFDPVINPLNVYANDVDAYIPEFWANEGLAILQENMVAANLVHRDFEPLLAKFGDVVNVRRPKNLKAYRKADCEDVTVQDVSATNEQVKLDQQIHTSFLICDGQESKSATELIDEFLQPAIVAQARFVDQMVLAQYVNFLDNSIGDLTGLTDANAVPYLLDVRQRMNDLLIPQGDRIGILNSTTETELLKQHLFLEAQQVGDGGFALREAALGRKFGINFFASQNMASIAKVNTSRTGAINLAAGYAKGTTTVLVDGFTGIIAAGTWVVIDGIPYQVVSHIETTGNTTSLTIDQGLQRGLADNAIVIAYTPGTVNFVGGYPANYDKYITIAGTTVAPQVGQAITFGLTTTGPIYTVLEATTTQMLLDRPLEFAIANTDAVNIGPAGNFSFFFTKNAIALVIRPLAIPKPGTGALSSVVSANGMSMRATITYDGYKQGHLVTLDFLAGIKVLDPNLGAVLLG
jgi:hypothetical protein